MGADIMSLNSLLWNRIDLYRNTLVLPTDSIGGYTRTVSLAIADVPCQIQHLSGEEKVIYGKNNVDAKYKIYFKPDFSIQSNDLIKYNGDYYDIVLIDNQCTKYNHLKVIAKLTKAPTIYYPESSSSESSEGYSSSSSSYSSSSSSIDSSSSI